MSFNKVIMAGRLARDPEKRISQDRKTFATFTIAVDRNYKKNETDFFDCVAFGNTADYLLSYVRKGYMILVEGTLQIDKWQDRNGVNHSKPKIIANIVKNFETKSKDADEVDNEIDLDKDKKNDEFENLFGDLDV